MEILPEMSETSFLVKLQELLFCLESRANQLFICILPIYMMFIELGLHLQSEPFLFSLA